MSDERWLSRKECAAYLGVSLSTVDDLVRKGMPSVKFSAGQNSTRRFWSADVDEWLRKPERAA